MPRIPQFQPQTGMPAGTGQVQANERPFVDPKAGEAKMWGQVADASTDLGKRIADYNHYEKRAQESVEALRLENQFRTDVDSYLSTFKERNDYDNFEGEAKEFLTQTWNKYSEQASSPAVKMALEKMYLNTSFQSQVFIRARKAQAIVETGEAEHGILRDNAIKMWVGADPAYRPIIAKGYEMKVRELADRQVFSLGKAEEFIRTFNSTAQELDFENKLYNDPRAALNDANNPDMYQDVDAVKRAKFAPRAKASVEAYGRDVDRQRKEQERIAKEKVKEAQKATGDLFVERYVNGALRETDILRSNLDPTGENSKEHWIKKIREKPTDPEGYKTDKVVETRLYSRIVRDPESVTEDEILNTIGKGLSHDDGKALINERRTRLKEPQDPAEKAIYDNLSRDRKAGLFGKGPEGDLEYAKQVEAFKKWRKANPKEDPSIYYEKLTTPYKKGLIGQWLDFAWPDKTDPKRRREELAGTQPQAQKGKPLVGYKNGKPVYDLGNGKWQVGE